ncbi:MAG TPA: isochorismatase family protein [Prolixibacteraceae bacterium]|nr:isochorismatase family protein [Prolixibacteraceae bacterium]
MKLDKQNTIVVVVDIQERLFSVMSNKELLLDNNKKLLAGAQVLDLPVLASQQYTKGLGETLPELSGLIENFSPIEKTVFSCYDEPDFISALEENDCKNIVLAGIESHVCVLQTAIDLKDAGYNPIVIFDCVSSRKESDKALALERFRHEGIMVTGMESFLFELTRGAKEPGFKEISKIVK